METRPDDRTPVAVHRARTGFEARVVVAVLADAGIEAFTPDVMLADEFAMSQRLMNLQGADVLVRAEDAEAASEALAEALHLGSWDRFCIPWPFARVELHYSLISVPTDSATSVEALRQAVEDHLLALTGPEIRAASSP